MSRNTTKISHRIKAGLALRGMTLASWARQKGYPMTTVWQAAHGTRDGRVAKKIKSELESIHA